MSFKSDNTKFYETLRDNRQELSDLIVLNKAKLDQELSSLTQRTVEVPKTLSNFRSTQGCLRMSVSPLATRASYV